MLTRGQQILLKRAQQQAALDDVDYRSAIATVSGHEDCRSSTDPRLTDENADNLLSYFEAIHWRKVDSSELQPSCKPLAVFRKRGYWAAKNRKGDNSRDRHATVQAGYQCQALEDELAKFGCGFGYFQAIQNRIVPFSVVKYRAALERTLRAKQRKASV
jgi:hypothetical protein